MPSVCLLLTLLLNAPHPGLRTPFQDKVHVAVASNFAGTMTDIASRFEQRTGHTVVLSFGSTGKHYAQIRNGAPFDVFFSADVERPRLLEEEGRTVAGSRFVYAIGKLVVWSPETDLIDEEGRFLKNGSFRFLAIANPRTAPYGRAARQVLEAFDLWEALAERIVRGENIAQAYQFVASGNAELGFVALSTLEAARKADEGSSWLVPDSLFDPIVQEAVLIRDSAPARSFLKFVRSEEIRALITDGGYDVE